MLKVRQDTRLCPKCGLRKSSEEFYVNKANKSGRSCWWASCGREKSKKNYAKNPMYMKKWLKANPNKIRWYIIKRKYGITKQDYEALLVKQDGKCAICGTTESKPHGYLSVDHCHNTGIVRGLLCHSCNVGIGHLRDDPTLIEKALQYLKGC